MQHLTPSQAAGSDVNEELRKIWIARYLPELGTIPSYVRKHAEQRLRASITDEARQATAHRLNQRLASDCAQASTATQQLLSKTGAISQNTWELQELNHKIKEIYQTLISSYEASFIFLPVVDYTQSIESEASRLAAAAEVMPGFEELILTIGPLVRDLKVIYFSSVNRHLVGFMTTQIHLTQARILSHLDPYDCSWLAPYFQIVDELLCMPWQRICSVATSNIDRTQTIAMVKKMLPKVSKVSAITYQQALCAFPHHTSCQGRIQSAEVQRSSIRDLSMFQAYIWLCVLEDSPSIIEKQLLPLCLQVFSLANVQWKLANFGIQTIIEIIRLQLTAEEQSVFKKQTDIIKRLFLDADPKSNQISLLKQQLEHSRNTVTFTWKP